jgi:hypothetical protein
VSEACCVGDGVRNGVDVRLSAECVSGGVGVRVSGGVGVRVSG